jgi:hypothetical protein
VTNRDLVRGRRALTHDEEQQQRQRDARHPWRPRRRAMSALHPNRSALSTAHDARHHNIGPRACPSLIGNELHMQFSCIRYAGASSPREGAFHAPSQTAGVV